MLKTNEKRVSLKNGVVGRYLRTLIRSGHQFPQFSSKLAQDMSVFVYKRVCEFERYLYNLAFNLDYTSVQYWKHYDRVQLNKLDELMADSVHNLHVFTGRR